MRKICAWCGIELSADDPESGPPSWVSHGICTSCQATLLSDIGQPLREFVASLPEPVFMLDGNATVLARSATAAFPPTLHEPSPGKRLLGDVFECAHARLPGGCGRTIHCSGCTIRRTVEDTYRTGRAHRRVPATLKAVDVAEPVALLVTTEKVGERVLLRVEPPTA